MSLATPPPPDARQLLPPLLACLPTSFISPHPPPALLPILAPVLRQRLNYIGGTNTNDGWLPLLSWAAEPSRNLPAVVERMQVEPHPVSGEIELDDVANIQYRRLDQETLHARLCVEQFGLLPTFVWCENDEHGGTGPGWKLADLRALEDSDESIEWHDSVSAANAAAVAPASATASSGHLQTNGTTSLASQPSNQDEDDDDYWAAYDRTPSRTPAQKASPAPPAMSAGARDRSQSELEYFARYGDVQPAMDSHDPDEAEAASLAGGSTLQGDALVRQQAREVQEQAHPGNGWHGSNPGFGHVSMPKPRSHTSSSGSSVDKLERHAAEMEDANDDRAQLGIKQHISTDIKSLYRLAKSVGMSRDDFTDIITRELDVLSMMDQDD